MIIIYVCAIYVEMITHQREKFPCHRTLSIEKQIICQDTPLFEVVGGEGKGSHFGASPTAERRNEIQRQSGAFSLI